MKKRTYGCILEVVLVCIILCISIAFAFESKEAESSQADSKLSALDAFCKAHDLSASDYPAHLLELMEANPETEEFVLHYPLRKGKRGSANLSELKNCDSVPLLMQWDMRWGYQTYGGDVLGITGCGPVCLSMVAVYLLNDPKIDPGWMADFSTKNGYCVPGNGTAWALMTEGASMLGLQATELPLDESRMIRELEMGNPIICIMGPGDFTTAGHFIVLTGVRDGKFTVNDPNSAQRSKQLWSYTQISGQIRNLWAFAKQ